MEVTDIKKMIEDSERNIINIISGNNKIQSDKMDKIINQLTDLTNRISSLEDKNIELERKIEDLGEKYKTIQKDNDDLKLSLQFTQDELIEKKINLLQQQFDEEFHKIYENNEYLKEKNRKLEDRTRRCNLRIDGVIENEHESWEETEGKVQKIFKEKLQLTNNIEIERAHRMSQRPNPSRQDEEPRPRTIILKLLRYKDKELILKNGKKLTNSGIFINEDFSDETNYIRVGLKHKMKLEREKGKYCVIRYDRLITREFKKKKEDLTPPV